MFGKWHVGLTAYDKAGNAINQNGLAAVQRIDYSRELKRGADTTMVLSNSLHSFLSYHRLVVCLHRRQSYSGAAHPHLR